MTEQQVEAPCGADREHAEEAVGSVEEHHPGNLRRAWQRLLSAELQPFLAEHAASESKSVRRAVGYACLVYGVAGPMRIEAEHDSDPELRRVLLKGPEAQAPFVAIHPVG